MQQWGAAQVGDLLIISCAGCMGVSASVIDAVQLLVWQAVACDGWLVWRSKGVNNFVCDMWGFRSECPAFLGIRAPYFLQCTGGMCVLVRPTRCDTMNTRNAATHSSHNEPDEHRADGPSCQACVCCQICWQTLAVTHLLARTSCCDRLKFSYRPARSAARLVPCCACSLPLSTSASADSLESQLPSRGQEEHVHELPLVRVHLQSRGWLASPTTWHLAICDRVHCIATMHHGCRCTCSQRCPTLT